MWSSCLLVYLIGGFTLVLSDEGASKILRYDNHPPTPNQNGDIQYAFNYETSNQIRREETGIFEKSADGEVVPVIKGSYSYVDPNGVTHEVFYVADKNGYKASSSLNKLRQPVEPAQYLPPKEPSQYLPPVAPAQYLPPINIRNINL